MDRLGHSWSQRISRPTKVPAPPKAPSAFGSAPVLVSLSQDALATDWTLVERSPLPGRASRGGLPIARPGAQGWAIDPRLSAMKEVEGQIRSFREHGKLKEHFNAIVTTLNHYDNDFVNASRNPALKQASKELWSALLDLPTEEELAEIRRQGSAAVGREADRIRQVNDRANELQRSYTNPQLQEVARGIVTTQAILINLEQQLEQKERITHAIKQAEENKGPVFSAVKDLQHYNKTNPDDPIPDADKKVDALMMKAVGGVNIPEPDKISELVEGAIRGGEVDSLVQIHRELQQFLIDSEGIDHRALQLTREEIRSRLDNLSQQIGTRIDYNREIIGRAYTERQAQADKLGKGVQEEIARAELAQARLNELEPEVQGLRQKKEQATGSLHALKMNEQRLDGALKKLSAQADQLQKLQDPREIAKFQEAAFNKLLAIIKEKSGRTDWKYNLWPSRKELESLSNPELLQKLKNYNAPQEDGETPESYLLLLQKPQAWLQQRQDLHQREVQRAQSVLDSVRQQLPGAEAGEEEARHALADVEEPIAVARQILGVGPVRQEREIRHQEYAALRQKLTQPLSLVETRGVVNDYIYALAVAHRLRGRDLSEVPKAVIEDLRKIIPGFDERFTEGEIRQMLGPR